MQESFLKRTVFIITLFFITQLSFSQLSNFTLSLSKTDETCLGNGTITFSVSGTVSGSNMDYTIYKLPNLVTPIAIQTTTTIGGLNAGNYRVVATQSTISGSGTQQQDITISNLIGSLDYVLTGVNVRCGSDGVITANAISGNPATFQIISGPVTTIPQSSNTFNNLPVGVYVVKVTDVCGNAIVHTYTLQQSPVSLIIENVSFPSFVLPSCNTINISNSLLVLTGYQIAYPLNIVYTIYPPSGGTPIIQNLTVAFGNSAQTIIPFYNDQSYYYNMTVTDACGFVYHKDNNVVNKKLDYEPTFQKVNCTDIQFKIIPKFYVAPYTLNVISAPTGFVPTSFNGLYPGPYSSTSVSFGGVSNSVPEGFYTIQLTDACGRNVTKTFEVNIEDPEPVGASTTDGCGKITITIGDIQLTSVIMISAPAAYTGTLPLNISSLINATGSLLTITGLPVGFYTFQVTDSCGIVHNLIVEIKPYVATPLTFVQRPGCQLGYGSVKIYTAEGIQNIKLLSAPVGYTGVVPYDYTSSIVSNSLYFVNVPEGNYTFEIKTNCGVIRTDVVNVVGYLVTNNNVNIVKNCGSFNVTINYTSNNLSNQFFWLQKYDPIGGTWGHPSTGSVYSPGSDPNATNSLALNPLTTLNLAYIGSFRILKRFVVFQENGLFTHCVDEIKTFQISEFPEITSLTSFNCSNGNYEIIVNAIGVAPLTYKIIEKNGTPLLINNGTSNIFTNLQPASYKFEVTDVCGNAVTSLYDLSALSPIAIQSSITCGGQNGSLSVPLYSFLTYQWWKDTNASTILSTSNKLDFTPFNATNDTGVYHVKIIYPSNLSSCMNRILDYTVSLTGTNPNAGQDNTVSYCGNQGIINLNNLIQGAHDSNGIWTETTSSGALTNNSWNSTNVASGTYQFKYTVNGFCGLIDESLVSITIKTLPQAPTASTDPVNCVSQPLHLYASSVTNATYNWTGPNGFVSSLQNPIIPNAMLVNSGVYSVKISLNGCDSPISTVNVQINSLPLVGTGSTNTYCGSQGVIDLFTLLSGTYASNGNWVETTSSASGTLVNNNWNTTSVLPGNYQFKYSIIGVCGSFAESVVNITIKQTPQTPIASVNPIICDTKNLELFASLIPNATYQWTGPNGFTSSDQNPIINGISNLSSGTYSVSVIENGCVSGISTVNVVVNSLPDFELTSLCEQNNYIVKATPVNSSYDESLVSYTWNGPNGFLGYVNPIVISGGDAGTYNLTIVNTDGCTLTKPILVKGTACDIPKYFTPNNDSANDYFDLSGFDVDKLEIYNRWGKVVYNKDGYLKEWNGQNNDGSLLPTSTYFYVIKLSTGEEKTGWVYLIRAE